MRDRASVLIIESEKVLLIKRVRENSVYYVFPGGGIEKGETPEQAAVREAYEELGAKVNIKDLLGTVEFQGTQYFFLADITDGEAGTGQGEEYTDPQRNRGTYNPLWIHLNELPNIDVRPRAVAEKIIKLS